MFIYLYQRAREKLRPYYDRVFETQTAVLCVILLHTCQIQGPGPNCGTPSHFETGITTFFVLRTGRPSTK